MVDNEKKNLKIRKIRKSRKIQKSENSLFPLEFSYKTYWYSIQRTDLTRLRILHPQPGIYADLDIHPCETNAEEHILTDASFIIGRSSEDICSINHFLIHKKYSDIINSILHEFHQKNRFSDKFPFFLISRFSRIIFLQKRTFLTKSEEAKLLLLS
jgi:mannosyltransferase OCH1-like enzyme